MQAFIIGYILFYILMSYLGIRESEKVGYPAWLIRMSKLEAVLSFYGMAFYYLGWESQFIKTFWKIVFLVIIGWQMRMVSYDHIAYLKNKGMNITRSEMNIGIVVSLILMFPNFYMNFMLAFR